MPADSPTVRSLVDDLDTARAAPGLAHHNPHTSGGGGGGGPSTPHHPGSVALSAVAAQVAPTMPVAWGGTGGGTGGGTAASPGARLSPGKMVQQVEDLKQHLAQLSGWVVWGCGWTGWV